MKKLFLFGCFLLIAGCGFEPLHGTRGQGGASARAVFEHISIANIPDREGQFLRNALIDLFYREGRPVDAPYTLNVSKIIETKRDLDITIESDATRQQLRLDTVMQLVDNESGEVLFSRSLYTISSFNVIENEFANRISEQNTRENALNDLARQIELQLSLYFNK